MQTTTCEHPMEQIRVIWHISKHGMGYRVLSPRAHCLACNSSLPETETNARLAIDLVMIECGRREKLVHDALGDEKMAEVIRGKLSVNAKKDTK